MIRLLLTLCLLSLPLTGCPTTSADDDDATGDDDDATGDDDDSAGDDDDDSAGDDDDATGDDDDSAAELRNTLNAYDPTTSDADGARRPTSRNARVRLGWDAPGRR